MRPSDAVARLALAVVLWDGANDDGCAFCEGEWFEDEPFVLHGKECPVVVHRMALIHALVDRDPAADSLEGKRLEELVAAQHRWEKIVFPARGGSQ